MNQGHDQESQVLAGTSYTKTITVQSELNDAWHGDFTFKMASVIDVMRAGIKQAELRGGVSPDALDFFTNQMARIVAELSVHVIKAPAWWYREVIRNNKKELEPYPEGIPDINLLMTIWEEYDAFRVNFSGSGGHTANRTAAPQPGAMDGGENPGSEPV